MTPSHLRSVREPLSGVPALDRRERQLWEAAFCCRPAGAGCSAWPSAADFSETAPLWPLGVESPLS